MNIFSGLNSAQMGALRHVREYSQIVAGATICAEGEPAQSLFAVISGEVSIVRSTRDGELELSRLGPGSVFGEMGILNGVAARTATARAVSDTTIFQLSPNPIEMFETLGDHAAGVVIVRNLICILGERLRAKDGPDYSPISWTSPPRFKWSVPNPEEPMNALREHLPRGWLQRVIGKHTLAPGKELCHEGEDSDGFYLIHEGTLYVEAGGEGEKSYLIGTISGPTVSGEIGYLSHQKRSSTLRAATPVVYEHFGGKALDSLIDKHPEDAFKVLFALAQILVCLILRREQGE